MMKKRLGKPKAFMVHPGTADPAVAVQQGYVIDSTHNFLVRKVLITNYARRETAASVGIVTAIGLAATEVMVGLIYSAAPEEFEARHARLQMVGPYMIGGVAILALMAAGLWFFLGRRSLSYELERYKKKYSLSNSDIFLNIAHEEAQDCPQSQLFNNMDWAYLKLNGENQSGLYDVYKRGCLAYRALSLSDTEDPELVAALAGATKLIEDLLEVQKDDAVRVALEESRIKEHAEAQEAHVQEALAAARRAKALERAKLRLEEVDEAEAKSKEVFVQTLKELAPARDSG